MIPGPWPDVLVTMTAAMIAVIHTEQTIHIPSQMSRINYNNVKGVVSSFYLKCFIKEVHVSYSRPPYHEGKVLIYIMSQLMDKDQSVCTIYDHESYSSHHILEINKNQDEPLRGIMWISGLGHLNVHRQVIVILYSTYKSKQSSALLSDNSS